MYDVGFANTEEIDENASYRPRNDERIFDLEKYNIALATGVIS